jgi:predicted NAD-dependent protein-ADP-ribosyltransferase YbiA (DUF1768 family)
VPKATAASVETLPEDKAVFQFYSKSADKDAAMLSNFAKLAVVVKGVKYKTGEHAFHASKLQCAANVPATSPERKEVLLNHMQVISAAPNAADAKKCGGRGTMGCELSVVEIEAWSNAAVEVQQEICRYKLDRYTIVRRVLLGSGTDYLLHQENRGQNPLWGGRINKQTNGMVGGNKLGKIWMQLRDDLEENKLDQEDDEWS